MLMFEFSGTLNRKEYVKQMLLLVAEVIVVSLVLLGALELLNAEKPGASTLSQALAILAFGLILLNIVLMFIAQFGIVMRRARDIGNTVLWTALALLFSPVILIMAFIPSNTPATD